MGGSISYTKLGTGYQGAGAPLQLIGNAVTYFDTVGKRTYQQLSNGWVLLP